MTRTVHIKCLQPGLLTTIQDQGRSGYQHLGIPPGGALDKQAARVANALVGNALQEPVLEITMIGPHLKFLDDCQIALTGARIPALADGHPLNYCQTLMMSAGTILRMGTAVNGCRSYLAIRGTWNIERWMGSASALTSTHSVHTPFAYLKKNTQWTTQVDREITPAKVPEYWRHDFSGDFRPRLMPGPEFFQADYRTVKSLLQETFVIGRDSNRMGYRLEAKVPLTEGAHDILSSAVLPGTIQITSSGKPILLLGDAQTTGGYQRIAQVIKADLDGLGQLKPGDEVGFVIVNDWAAQKALELYHQREHEILGAIRYAQESGAS
ncbi:MAG: biotin-dependent carboxyltransferase [Saprospiraceae bacterium]|nr:biotin-dependent carboxyltransferase [Saprospiraceae bacterium]